MPALLINAIVTMGLDFAAYKNTYICYADDVISALSSLPECKVLTIARPGTGNKVDNFADFTDSILSGRDLAIIAGNSSENELAATLERNFKEEFELSGILSFKSNSSTLVVKNRHGAFALSPYEENGRLVEPCVLFRLHNFQRDVVYICGSSKDSLEIGATAFLSIYGGPFFGDLISDDAFFVLGSMSQDRTMISKSCFHLGGKVVDESSLTIQKLRLLDRSYG